MRRLSVWEKETYYAPQDIIIVGAGLMGLWTALELKKARPSLTISILEKSSTPLGASTRNAGFACFGSPTELLADMAQMGTDAMLELAEMRYKGIEKIRQHFTDAAIGYEACGGYECFTANQFPVETINDQLAQLNQLLLPITGNAALFTRTDAKMQSLALQHFDALVSNASEAALHSGKLVQELTRKVLAAGVTMHMALGLKEWEAAANGLRLITTEGIDLHTRLMVCCTNGFTQALLKRPLVQPARGQILLTTPISGLPMKGTFHYQEGYYYWRNLGNRLLLGGARNEDFAGEATTSLEGSQLIREKLEAFLRKHVNPCLSFTIEQSWSGIMGFTETKKPWTGFVDNGIYASIACNGMGVALTPMVAEKAAADILAHF